MVARLVRRFPAFTFYMIIPSLLIVLVNVGVGGGAAVPVVASGVLAAGRRLGARPDRRHPEPGRGVYAAAVVAWLLIVPVPYGVA